MSRKSSCNGTDNLTAAYYTAPGGQTLISIQTADYLIAFTVPLSVTIGQHVWTIYCDDANGRQTFVGQDAFESSNATALAFIANAVYNNATNLANQGHFVSTISTLRNASVLIVNAFNAEATLQNLKKTFLSDLSQVDVTLARESPPIFRVKMQRAT